MKYHSIFLELGKMSQNLSSAAVVIGALRVNMQMKGRWKIVPFFGPIITLG